MMAFREEAPMPGQLGLSESMRRIDRLIHSTLKFDEIIQRVITEAAQVIGSETAAISLRQGKHWVVSHVHGLPEDTVGSRMDDRQEPHAVLAIRTKQPVVIRDAFTDERVNRAHMKKWGVRSVLVVPLVTEDETVGVLFFNHHRTAVSFEQAHVDFAGRLASSLSLAWRNARLLESLQGELAERRKIEQALQEANERLQVQTEELQTQQEELQAQAEELRAQAEELRAREQALHRLNEELERRVAERTADLSQANVALGQAGAYHRRLLEASLDPLVTIGPDGKITDVNAATESATGHPRGRLIGTDFADYFTAPADARAGCQRAFRDGFVRDYPLALRHTSGRVMEVLYNATVYRDEAGSTLGVFAAARDVTERHRAEQAARAERQRFNDLLETLPAYVILLTSDYRVSFANRFFRERFGELQGRRCYEYLFDRTEPCEVCETFRTLQTMTPLEWEWIGPDRRHYYIHDFPFTDADGSTLIMEMGLDITEHRRAERALQEATEALERRVAERTAALQDANEQLQVQAEELQNANEELRVQSVQLQESEQRLRLALAGGRMGLWEWDLRTDASLWDARVYELLGLETFTKAHIGTFLARVHLQDRETLKQRIQDAVTDRMDLQAEFRVLHRPAELRGEILWLALRSQILRDGQGEPVRLIGVLYDVTERKQMEAELRRLTDQLQQEVRVQTEELQKSVARLQDEVTRRVLAEDRLRHNSRMLEAFFRHTVTPMAFLDQRFCYVRVNEAFAHAVGQPVKFFARRSHFSLFPSAEDRTIFEQVVRTKEPYEAQARLFAFAGSSAREMTYWNWRITPLLDEAGRVQFLVLGLEDVTERQAAFGELEHRAGQLQKLTLELAQAEDRERRRLAEVLHDDLQQVLAAAKFHLGLLTSRLPGDAPAQELGRQLTALLKEAIEKSRNLSHELSPAVLYQSDLGETFEWLARQVQAKHGLVVHTEVHGRIDSKSEPIKAFLFRAAQEILFNAVKHAKVAEARLRLQCRRRRLWLTIGDRGRGFDPHTLNRTRGFGLFSIRERVELLGGRMRIRSAKDRGSTFLIVVPDAGARDEAAGAKGDGRNWDATPQTKDQGAAVAPRPSGSAPLRVLLVDDHETIRAGLAALIGEQPDMVVVGQTGDGRRAVDLARGLAPDVVIMDVAMPMMPGDEASRRIKAALPHIRVLALSMFEEPGVARRMLDAGAEVYLTKTGPSDRLLAAIRGPA